MKNDIRRYYSRMLMNQINSGDFTQLQSYFSTFMTGNTNFIANYDNFDPQYRIPPRLVTCGPKLMSHFLLGIFVMYPDMVMQMDNSVITTSSSWSGTKIEMNVRFNATKICDLADDEWVPSLHILEEKCNQLAGEKRNKLVLASDVSSTDEQRSGMSGSHCYVRPSISSSVSSCHSIVADPLFGEDCADQMHPNHTTFHRSQSQELPHRDVLGIAAHKRQRLLSALEDTSLSSVNTDTAALQKVRQQDENFISEEYVRALCAQATLLPEPVEVHMSGTITMLLDKNIRIQHMNMKVHQTQTIL